MALGFILIALVLIVAAFRNTYGALFTQLEQDGPGFLKWAVAIVVIGLLQYIPNFQTAAKYLLVLVLLVIVIVNKGAFQNFTNAFNGTPPSVQGGPTPTLTGNPTITIGTGGSSPSGVLNSLPGIGGISNAISSLTGGFFGGLF